MASFEVVIEKLGINPVATPPQAALAGIFRNSGRTKGPIPVRGKINGIEFIQTLVKFRGAWRLYINGQC